VTLGHPANTSISININKNRAHTRLALETTAKRALQSRAVEELGPKGFENSWGTPRRRGFKIRTGKVLGKSNREMHISCVELTNFERRSPEIDSRQLK